MKPIRYTFLCIWVLVSLYPLVWMLITAFKPGTSVIAVPPDLRLSGLTFANFRHLLDNPIIWRWTGNSFGIALISMVGNAILGSMAGYSFAKKEYPGKRVLFWLVMLIMMTSTQIIMVPLFMLVRDMGLLNSYGGLLLPVLVSPFYVFLSKQFIETIPSEMIQAARIDGCSEWAIYWRIMVPLIRPVLAIIAIFTFVTQWNDFLWPLLVSESNDMRTLQTGIATLQQQNMKDYGLLLAGAVWTLAPVLIIFLIFQRFFIKGITVGAVKG